MFSYSMEISPSTPFSFELSAEIFSDGDRQIRIYQERVFKQVIRVKEKLVLVCISSQGTVKEPLLEIKLESETKLTKQDREKAKLIVTRLFNLDFDPFPFYEAVGKDETIKKITQRLCGLRSPSTQTVHEAVIDSIVEQQISLKAATSIEKRIIKRFGETMKVEGEMFYAYPTSKALSLASMDDLQGCGLSQRKAEYIKEISELETSGKLDLEKLEELNDTRKIIEKLDSIRGIGLWTAELTIIRSMRKWDALPADDIGLRRVISHYYCGGKRITAEQARKIAEAWGKWRGLAAFYLIVAEMLNIETSA